MANKKIKSSKNGTAVPEQQKLQPIDTVIWRHVDELKPNDYNPNSQAPPEKKLLSISMLEDGWTQPIVINPDMTIVDGFNRWENTKQNKNVYAMTGGKVPTVMLIGKDKASQKMSTIRHNRARGTHAVLKMADIIEQMLKENISTEEISERLQMEEEGIFRLANRKGIPKTDIIANAEFSKSWKPRYENEDS